MNILVINCGSSSLKYQLINSASEEVLAKGLCERIGIDGKLTYQPEGGEKEKSDVSMPTHTEAIDAVIKALTNEKTALSRAFPKLAQSDTAWYTAEKNSPPPASSTKSQSRRLRSAMISLLCTIRPT